MKNCYRDVKASILKLCVNFITEYNQLHPGMELQFFNFEAGADPSEWPEANALGPAQIEVDLEDGMVEALVGVGVTTRNDPNLFNLDEICNLFANKVMPGQMFTIFDQPTGAPIRPMKVAEGTRIGRVERTKTQPARMIIFRGLVAGPASSPAMPGRP